ncbi:MAG: hypothetical protein M1814_004083 [Vezdaea aestivalis]|nr:MAG: hypothetical protein M1814_004083 [Vezdaea aestivalis]
MSSLNLSTNGPSITKSYQSVVESAPSSGPAAKSITYGQWAVFSVSAPLVTAFQQDSAGKESVLKVQSTGEGELVDLIDEFSDGRIQFAFLKIKDTNTTLSKFVLIGWCGEGVPERTKGYFTSHLAAVSKIFHGYHVQITARSERDLTPEGIVQKVADSSGSKYSAGSTPSARGPPPPAASKPVFNPTRVGGGGAGFNPLTSRSRAAPGQQNVDEDGWGDDAPQVTRTQLQKVDSAYKPTKVNMKELMGQKPEPSRYDGGASSRDAENAGIIGGGYQPVGKVDIAAIRKKAQGSGTVSDDRPTTIKGAYEPTGKVDIAAIRAKAQKPGGEYTSSTSHISPVVTGTSAQSASDPEEPSRSLADRSSAFTQSERLTALPKPKVSNRFSSGGSTFTGTKAPIPGGFDSSPSGPSTAPVGSASRTFADSGGKTPAQLWAEKKARDRGLSGASETQVPSPIPSQPSGSTPTGGEWKSGYTGKSWAAVQTTKTGRSGGTLSAQPTGESDHTPAEHETPSAGGISSIRDRFSGSVPMGAPAPPTGADRSAPSPPPLAMASKPSTGIGARAIPGMLPTRPREDEEEDERAVPRIPTPPVVPRSPTPPTPPSMRPSSPIRVARPVGRGYGEEPMEAPEERLAPVPVPTGMAVPKAGQLADEDEGYQAARQASQNAAAATFGAAQGGGKRALVQYDYEKAEDNEIDLVEGEYVHDIDMVDTDWWQVTNERGQSGLVPANYLELLPEEAPSASISHPIQVPTPEATPPPPAAPAASSGKTATAIYDYEAAEDNELSFPEGATITGVEFPDEDWWSGTYKGKEALFPASYVELDK